LVAPASAHALSCGDTVDHSITLHADLDCSAGGTDGLDVDDDNVTIDLNGHSITGAGVADARYGINSETFDGLVIKDGTVEDFYEDIRIYGGADPVVRNVDLSSDDSSASSYGLDVEYVSGGNFSGLTAKNLYYGLVLEYAGRNQLSKSKVTHTQYGVYVYEESGTKISRVKVSEGEGTFPSGFYDYYSHKTLYSHDTATGPDLFYGFYIDYPLNVRIDRSTGTKSDYYGVYVSDNDPESHYHATLTNNLFKNNADYGAYADYSGTSGSNNTSIGNPYGCYLVPCG
jgi:hypothetical protein